MVRGQGSMNRDMRSETAEERTGRESGRGKGIYLLDLDSTHLQTLITIANSGVHTAAQRAQNLLCFAYGMCKDYPSSSGGNSPARRARPTQNPQQVIQDAYYQLKVYPNPTREYTTFDWSLMDIPESLHLMVFDALGKVVVNQPVHLRLGQWLWDTRNVPAGIYLYQLKPLNGESLQQGKVIIEK